MTKFTEDQAGGMWIFSALAGLAVGPLSAVELPWYAAIGTGIATTLLVVFGLCILFSIET